VVRGQVLHQDNGHAGKEGSNPASPPADAPMPTTGHPGATCSDGGSAALGSRVPSQESSRRSLASPDRVYSER
jgi:hypothetical protein